MADSRIYLKNRPYYLYDTYSTRAAANKQAQYAKRKYKSRYFIHKTEDFWGNIHYRLYLTRLRRIWS